MMRTSDLRRTIGDGMRERRLALGLTQFEAAEEIGIASESYARIERGYATPGMATFAKICEALDADANVLLGWRPTKGQP